MHGRELARCAGPIYPHSAGQRIASLFRMQRPLEIDAQADIPSGRVWPVTKAVSVPPLLCERCRNLRLKSAWKCKTAEIGRK